MNVILLMLHQIMTTPAFFDGMAVVNDQAVFKGVISNCEELAVHFVNALVRKSSGYKHSYVIFDNYGVVSSLKENTRNQRTKGKS